MKGEEMVGCGFLKKKEIPNRNLLSLSLLLRLRMKPVWDQGSKKLRTEKGKKRQEGRYMKVGGSKPWSSRLVWTT